jgi:predicted glycoside hydrolase/deacetylase ChbG (UPF0249 family)
MTKPTGASAVPRSAADGTGVRVAFHADDFGMNRRVSLGIVEGFEYGLLTSASWLANAPDADYALTLWKTLLERQADGTLTTATLRRRLGDPEIPFDLGIHVNLTQGRPLTAGYPTELLDAEGLFPGVYGLLRRTWHRGERIREAVFTELAAQIERMLDQGVRPSHLNGHQYVETLPPVAAVVPRLLQKYSIRIVRNPIPRGGTARWTLRTAAEAAAKGWCARRYRLLLADCRAVAADACFGTLDAGRIDAPLLAAQWAKSAPFKLAEVVMHPSLPAAAAEGMPAEGWNDPLERQRPGELRFLCSTALPELLEVRRWQLGRLRALTFEVR